MNKTFSKFNNKEEVKANGEISNNSIYKNSRKSSEKDRTSLSFYENRNNNLRSVSPITHKKNNFIESHKLIEIKIEKRHPEADESNISYFEEFNVKT